MNCAECQELLVSYIEHLLDDSQRQTVEQHLNTCQACRKELEGLQTLQDRLVTNGKAVAQTSVEDQVMNRIIREQNVRLKSAKQAGVSLRPRRFLKKSAMAKVAAAAVVVVTCALAVSMWHQTTQFALADVLAKVEKVQAYLYRERTTIRDETHGTRMSEATVLMSNVYGMKSEQTTVHDDGRQTRLWTYLLPQDKSVVIVDANEKQYTRMGLDEATLENMKIEKHDPRQMIKRLLACEYTNLGTAVIDGIKAQGFATTAPSYLGESGRDLSATLWVAADTWLPVRYELEMERRDGGQLRNVQDQFQWGIPVNAGDFEPDIPADFTANEMDGFQMPSYSEEGVIEALRMVVEFTGHYPKALTLEAVQQLAQEMVTSETPAAQQLREQLKDAGSPDEAARMSQKHLMGLMVLPTFPRMLVTQQAAPVYYGDVVTPADATLPLMRWKTADNEYRVIFGDLHAETVTAETLAELEAALPK